MEDKNLAS